MRPHDRSHLALFLSALALLAPTAGPGLSAQGSILDAIPWTEGPAKGPLGLVAEVGIPSSCRFTGHDGARKFLIATENPPSGKEEGVLLCQVPADSSYWFVVFTFDPSGLVKDDDKTKLDANKILKTMQEGTKAGNEERRRQGWSELTVLGWQRAPYYDEATHNLTWS